MALQAGETRDSPARKITDADGRLVVVTASPGGAAAATDVTDRAGRLLGVVDTEMPAAALLGDTMANPTAPGVGAFNALFNNGQWERWYSAASRADAFSGGGLGAIANWLFNGATFERQRVAAIFKSLASTAITAGTGATIWTPAAGKKFRVLGIAFSSSVAGQLILGDNAVGTVIARSPALAAGGIWQLGKADLENGILSALANNVLKIDGPTGNVAGMVWGTEE